MERESGDHVQLRASRGVYPLSPTVDMSIGISASRSNMRSLTIRPYASKTSGGIMLLGSPGEAMTIVPPVSPPSPAGLSFVPQAIIATEQAQTASEKRISGAGGWESYTARASTQHHARGSASPSPVVVHVTDDESGHPGTERRVEHQVACLAVFQ